LVELSCGFRKGARVDKRDIVRPLVPRVTL